MKVFIPLSLILLTGCSTERDLLRLQRDQLLRIEKNAMAVRQGVAQGSFDPRLYDAYLAVDADVFDRVLSTINGYSVEIEASGRPVTISVNAFAMNFRPGSPEIRLDAEAIDKRSGLKAAVKLDSRLIIEGDLQDPGKLKARIVATKIVPDLSWGPLNFTKARFVRSLLALEASRYTEKLPEMTLPVSSDFTFGSPAASVDSGRLDTGNGSWIRGNISYPDTVTSGRFVVKNILFLNNGVHLFAMVEGV